MKTIPLTQGKVALVDDEDYPKLILHKWYAKMSHSQWYAVRKEGVKGYPFRTVRSRKRKKDTRKTIRMHNQIMQPWDEMLVHHKDENSLNNQKSNLEVCTKAMNKTYADENLKKRIGEYEVKYG